MARCGSGKIIDAPGETWRAVESALRNGRRGLPGGSSLARFLHEHRKKCNPKSKPPLTLKKILAWADAYHEHTGKWPTAKSGPVADAPDETWNGIEDALRQAGRGLRRRESLRRLLIRKRDVPDRATCRP